METISRQLLDFDFEKCCSVSLSPVNVYACLVCGKYFQVRTARGSGRASSGKRACCSFPPCRVGAATPTRTRTAWRQGITCL